MKFGRYELRRRISADAIEEVWLASVVAAGAEQRCALKRLHPQVSADERCATVFAEDARRIARVNHPAVAQVYDFGLTDGQYFIAMEYVDGPNLQELLDELALAKVRLPEQIAIHIGSAVCDAIDGIHRAQDAAGQPLAAAHGDLQASRVCLGLDGSIKLVGFGGGRLRRAAIQSGLIAADSSGPADDVEATAAAEMHADVAGVASLIWQMCCGEEANHIDRPLGRPGSGPDRSAGISDALARVLTQAREPMQATRYPDAESLLNELRNSQLPEQPALLRQNVADWLRRWRRDGAKSPKPSAAAGQQQPIDRAVSSAAAELAAEQDGRASEQLGPGAPAAGPSNPEEATPGVAGVDRAARPDRKSSAPVVGDHRATSDVDRGSEALALLARPATDLWDESIEEQTTNRIDAAIDEPEPFVDDLPTRESTADELRAMLDADGRQTPVAEQASRPDLDPEDLDTQRSGRQHKAPSVVFRLPPPPVGSPPAAKRRPERLEHMHSSALDNNDRRPLMATDAVRPPPHEPPAIAPWHRTFSVGHATGPISVGADGTVDRNRAPSEETTLPLPRFEPEDASEALLLDYAIDPDEPTRGTFDDAADPYPAVEATYGGAASSSVDRSQVGPAERERSRHGSRPYWVAAIAVLLFGAAAMAYWWLG